MERLPVLLSIPHAGTETPQELQGRTRLRTVDVWNDIDAFSRQVYDLSDRVAVVIATDIARTFVDLNRAADDRPPDNPDGVIKTYTCYKEPIYTEDLDPRGELVEQMLGKYYYPYHHTIRDAVAGGPTDAIQLGIDCHTMSDVGPEVAPDPRQKRPMVCLGNVHGRACSQVAIDRMAASFIEAFGFDAEDVTQNEPFAGGHITKHYGANPVPWIQIEMNQSLYLKPRASLEELPQADPARLRRVHENFEETLRLYFDRPA